MSNKLIALVGPTSSGKSELAVRLAKRFNGEIISADSRQIYRGMNLGTGKVKGKWNSVALMSGRTLVLQKVFKYKGVTHHLIDYVNPKRQYSSALFQRDAKKPIADILKRGKLPILCGGTAHWIDAVVYNQTLPDVKPNPQLRLKLSKKSTVDLYQQLKKLDPVRAKTIDSKNPHRLIRALEIVLTTGKPVPAPSVIPAQAGILNNSTRFPTRSGMTHYNALRLGIKIDRKILYKKISLRLKQRLKQGMVKEVEQLHNEGLSWKKLMDFGLEYKFVSLFLQKKLTRQEMFTKLSFAIQHYAKRQLTWWKRNKDIVWITKPAQAAKLVEKFLA